MFLPENKIKAAIKAVVPPFAAASAILLLALSLAEYLRPGFVSLFLDFRILAIVTLVLWIGAVSVEAAPRQKWLSSIPVALALAAGFPVLWRMTAPYGRLGLATLVCGIASLIAVFFSSLKHKP